MAIEKRINVSARKWRNGEMAISIYLGNESISKSSMASNIQRSGCGNESKKVSGNGINK